MDADILHAPFGLPTSETQGRELSLQEDKLRERSRPWLRAFATALALALSFFVWCLPLERIVGFGFDLAIRLRAWGAPLSSVVTVAYDDAASLRYNDTRRVPPQEIWTVLERLRAEDPASVTVLLPMDGRSYDDAELAVITAAVKETPRAILGFTDDATLERPLARPIPLPGRFLAGVVSRDSYSFGADHVSRRVLISVDGQPTVYGAVACRYGTNARAEAAGSEISCLQQLRGNDRDRSRQTLVDWRGGSGAYHSLSSGDVAAGRTPFGSFRGKHVIFGSALRDRREADFVRTPYDHEPLGTSALEAAAQGLATLLRDTGIIRAPVWLVLLATLLCGALTANLALSASPVRGLTVCALCIVGLLGVYLIGLYGFGVAGDFVRPATAAALCYYFAIPYRLFEEYEKRWHYQEKSEYISELERMKSNFVSLVSHDLRTPIARIQGAAELLIAEQSDPARRDRALRAIEKSAQDLGDYVESVLDLTRVENAKVPLDRATRDLNETVAAVVKQKQSLAEEKKISIDTHLEPLFAFRFDERLVRRVVGNLVENAVKYSPEGSAVNVVTSENRGYVTVAVEDSGIGIALEDQDKIFDKFFRTAEAETCGKGMGLGLYLVKYFVELHGGSVELVSRPGRGSRFSVHLPM